MISGAPGPLEQGVDTSPAENPAVDYDELVARAVELLRRERRVSYRALKRRFGLDDDDIEDLKDELASAKRVAVDEDSRVLVFAGEPDDLALPVFT